MGSHDLNHLTEEQSPRRLAQLLVALGGRGMLGMTFREWWWQEESKVQEGDVSE